MRPEQKAAVMALALDMLSAYFVGIMSMPILLFGALSSNLYVTLYGAIGMIASSVLLLSATRRFDNMKKVKQ